MKNNRLLSIFTLFGSTGTLFCCALPALLVSIGAGSVMASLVSSYPSFVLFSIYKVELFIITGLLLFVTGIIQYKARKMPCPIDEDKAKKCSSLRNQNKIIYFISLAIYLTGSFMAFVAPKIFF